ncbi:MAG: hypothetical protein KAT46_06550 [Deltaproteobacteria bacterium]|nr:hypothetical protein [Deltaproteobacteria bacterium]
MVTLVRCERCGFEGNSTSAVFCSACGMKLIKDPEDDDEDSSGDEDLSDEGSTRSESALEDEARKGSDASEETEFSRESEATTGKTQGSKTGAIAFLKMPVPKLIILTVITAGIYSAIWFLKQIPSLNNLNAGERFTEAPFGFVIAACVVNIGLAFYIVSVGAVVGDSTFNEIISWSNMLSLGVQLVMLFQTLKARMAIISHYKNEYGKDLDFSLFLTVLLGVFFLSIFYLQYKINRFEEVGSYEGKGIYKA